MLNLAQSWEKSYARGKKKNQSSSSPVCHRGIITSNLSITVREGQERGAEDGSTDLKELSDEVDGEGGYVLNGYVSFQFTELFSDSSRVCLPFRDFVDQILDLHM